MYFNNRKITPSKGGTDANDLNGLINPAAPITKEVANDQLNLGLNIDTDTMVITQDGKLAALAGGGGATKYLHQGQCSISFTNSGVSYTFHGVTYSFINETSTPCTDSDFRTQYSGNKIVLSSGSGFIGGNEYGILSSITLEDLQYNFGQKLRGLNISTPATIYIYQVGIITVSNVTDSVTEL